MSDDRDDKQNTGAPGPEDFSLEEIRAKNWILEASTFDLHRDPVLNQNNIMTEYEEKFSSMGHPICKLIARPK